MNKDETNSKGHLKYIYIYNSLANVVHAAHILELYVLFVGVCSLLYNGSFKRGVRSHKRYVTPPQVQSPVLS